MSACMEIFYGTSDNPAQTSIGDPKFKSNAMHPISNSNIYNNYHPVQPKILNNNSNSRKD